jgi:spore maturation protein CgeB
MLISARPPRVLIVGASPDILNNNAVLRANVLRGFAELLGPEAAAQCPLEAGIQSIGLFRPDLVVCFGSCMPDICYYGPIRDLCDHLGIGLAFWLHDDPYEFDCGHRAAEVADWLFSNDRWATRHHAHPRVYHLPLAGCPEVHQRPWQEVKNHDVFFCGVAFDNRQQMLRDLQSLFGSIRCQILGADWPKDIHLAENRRLGCAQLMDHYAASWLTLNIGRSLQLANVRFQLAPSTPGPRTFEAALAGTVQLYFADSLEILDYFEADEEIVLFDDPESCAKQVAALLADPERARRIAEAARAKALREHTYAHRAASLLAYCGFDIPASR